MLSKFQVSRQLALLAVLAGLLVLFPAQARGQGAPAKRTHTQGVLIRFEGPIFLFTEKVLERQLARARKLGADLVVIEINSPGGEVESSFRCAEMLEAVNFATTVAWVPEMALSGAAIMSLGADLIVMHPNARLGDAGPIYANEFGQFELVPEKIRSDLSIRIRNLAERTHRPPALAQAMVDNTLVVFRVQNKETGQESFMTDNELQVIENPGQWKKLEQVFKPNNNDFLEVTGEKAVDLQLAEMVVQDRDELARELGMAGEWRVLESTWVDTTVFVLNMPLVTGLLFVVGLVALFIEFSAPGISIGGLLAILCFSLFFWGKFLGGTAGWLEVVLFLLGIIFLMLEVFLIPGFGVPGIAGILLIVASLVMASQDFFMPTTPSEWKTTGNSLMVVLGSGVGVIVLSIFLTRYMGEIPILSRLALAPSERTGSAPTVSVLTSNKGQSVGLEHLEVGNLGIAETPLRPAGKAAFDEEFFDVVSEGDFVNTGEWVRIVEIQGNRVVVRKYKPKS
jgi:membrane-bound serine protease (ClpP class)